MKFQITVLGFELVFFDTVIPVKKVVIDTVVGTNHNISQYIMN